MCAQPFALTVSNELAFHPLTPSALLRHWKERSREESEADRHLPPAREDSSVTFDPSAHLIISARLRLSAVRSIINTN